MAARPPGQAASRLSARGSGTASPTSTAPIFRSTRACTRRCTSSCSRASSSSRSAWRCSRRSEGRSPALSCCSSERAGRRRCSIRRTGWPMGAAILGAALVLLAGLGSRRLPALALPAAAVVVIAAVAVGSATAARHGLVHWQTWNLAHVASGPTDVGFVWNAQYGGLTWSGQPMTVLQVQSDQPPTYLARGGPRRLRRRPWVLGPPRPADSLEPPAAFRPQNETREIVTVDALADTHLVGWQHPDPLRGRRRGAARQVRAGLRSPRPEPSARLPVHGLELYASAGRGRAAPLAAGLPAEADAGRPVRRRRRRDAAAVRNARPPRERALVRRPPAAPSSVPAARTPGGEGGRRRAAPRTARSRTSRTGSSPPARSTTRTTRP